LAQSQEYIFVATQAGLPLDATGGFYSGYYLLVYQRKSLLFLAFHPLRRVRDAHSICYFEGRLYIVSTGTDEVVEIRLDGHRLVSEEVCWRYDRHAPVADINHLNGICVSPEGLVVTGFGERNLETQRWSNNGFVFNLTRNQMLISGLEQPHSPLSLNGSSIAYCESAKERVGIAGDDRTLLVPGYSRGLCQVGEFLYAGTSQRRTMSRSTGAPVTVVPNSAICTINRISISDFSVVSQTQPGHGLGEIYDLLPLAEDPL
jgi:hypothetical protein